MSAGAQQTRSTIAAGVRSDTELLRSLAVTAGLCWSVLFVAVGLDYGLQMYGDGSIFSYAVAVQDAWAFHWHNIPDRLFVYLFAMAPADTYVALFHDARGGIVIYGLLFFIAPLLGLIATFIADRSPGRIIFATACFSTACLCPLVFGFPTEVWMAHALFWPALAVCHYARNGIAGTALVFVALLSMTLTHEGALIFAVAILITLVVRSTRDGALLRAIGAFCLALAIWTVIKRTYPPDAYIADVLTRAALTVFDVSIFSDRLVLLLAGTVALYVTALFALRTLSRARAHIYAVIVAAIAVAIYWLRFDHGIHAENRYYLRTALLVMTPALGAIAAAQALRAEGRLMLPAPFLHRLLATVNSDAMARILAGVLMLVTLVHVVETAKFVHAWKQYKTALRVLSVGVSSDPALGDEKFVSSRRISPALNRLSWFSTTPYLSVLVAPRYAPSRLVVDPITDYFWISCRTATASVKADRAVPYESRRLIQKENCIHRPQ